MRDNRSGVLLQLCISSYLAELGLSNMRLGGMMGPIAKSFYLQAVLLESSLL